MEYKLGQKRKWRKKKKGQKIDLGDLGQSDLLEYILCVEI
jgi:hypothetical protein